MRLGLISLLGLMISQMALAIDYPPIGVPMKVEKLGEHSYYVRGEPGMATDNEGFISNAGFVVTNDGVVLFDALGTPSLAHTMLGLIRQVTDQPVKRVVVSHYHADHIYGLQVFKDEGADIWAPQGVYDYLESEAAGSRLEERQFSLDPWVNEKTYLVPPDRLIGGVEHFSMGGVDFQISYLGSAHSEGDLTLYVANDRVLYSGDIIFEGRVPFVGDADTKHWLKTLKQLETNDLKALVPGHGPAADKPLEAIRMTREYLAYLREVFGQAVEDLNDFASAYDEADWSAYEQMPAFEATHRRNAYQVFLSLEAEALAE